MLTRTVQTPALILSQTQGFSNQHPGFHSCAKAHSKYPHPIPDGAESTSLGLLRTYKHNQRQIAPSYYHRATETHPASGMSPTREVISRIRLSPHTELPPHAGRAQHSTHIFQAWFTQGAEPKASETIAAARPPHKLWSINHLPLAPYCPSAVTQRRDMTMVQQCHTLQHGYQWSGPLLLPEGELGTFKKRTSPP